jgi:hypothetical protein
MPADTFPFKSARTTDDGKLQQSIYDHHHWLATSFLDPWQRAQLLPPEHYKFNRCEEVKLADISEPKKKKKEYLKAKTDELETIRPRKSETCIEA